MNRLLGACLLLAASAAHGLDTLEFQLYGFNGGGELFDIRPYGKDSWAKGDFSEAEGLKGEYFRWVGNDKAGSFELVGFCAVRQNDKAYTFSCKKGVGPLAGVSYEGEALNEKKAMPEAKDLEKKFMTQYEYGGVEAFFRCKRSCSAQVPSSLIMVWRGD